MRDRPSLPPLSHLQALALGLLRSGDRPGRLVREAMAGYGVRHSAAAFYQMMARLERDGFVAGRYEAVWAGDQQVTERWYLLTAAGERAWQRTQAFYQAIGRAADEGYSPA
jgi:DNA-binding PadR family transcriptional regulator